MAKPCHSIFLPPPLRSSDKEMRITGVWEGLDFTRWWSQNWGVGGLCLTHVRALTPAPGQGSQPQSAILPASLPPRISLYP